MRRADGWALRLSLMCAMAVFSVAGAHGQGWIVDLSAGRSVHDAAQAAIGVIGVSVGLRHQGTPWLLLSAGAPFDSAGVPWAGAAIGGRVATSAGPLTLGVDLSAQGFAFVDRSVDDTGGGGTVEAFPVVRTTSGPLGVELRSGVMHYAASMYGATTSRTVHQTDVRTTLARGGLLLAGDARYLRAPEGSYPLVGAAVEMALLPVTLTAHGGRWLSDAISTPVWGIAGRVTLPGGAEAYAAYQQETNDPLYWNLPRRTWTLGISRRLGSRRAALVPTSATVAAPGEVSFRLPLAAAASPPSVAGDFSGWNEVRMMRAGDEWIASVRIPAGIYRYAFKGADGEWFVPEGHPGREPDGFGGFNALLIVQRP